VTSYQKSDSVNRKKNPAKFHPDPIGAWAIFEEVAPTTRRTTTRRVAISDQFLVENGSNAVQMGNNFVGMKSKSDRLQYTEIRML